MTNTAIISTCNGVDSNIADTKIAPIDHDIYYKKTFGIQTHD